MKWSIIIIELSTTREIDLNYVIMFGFAGLGCNLYKRSQKVIKKSLKLTSSPVGPLKFIISGHFR